ncbi:MAG: hypothetical protein E7334_05185 [Clostridiales bacterium]|nr:hypothetical protein [Clostridiales bacterium]
MKIMKKDNMPYISGGKEIFTDSAYSFELTEYPWGNPNGYDGKVYVHIGYSDRGIHVGFTVYESKAPRAKQTQNNSAVCTDSCVEFFFRPDSKKELPYINIEMNSLGTMLLKHSFGRHETYPIDRNDESIFEKYASGWDGEKWRVSYCIPYSVITSCFPDIKPLASGSVISCNFYKCGDHTEKPHYITRYPIMTEKPDYHRPEYFREVTLL